MKCRWTAFLLTICVLLVGCTSSKGSADNQNTTIVSGWDSSTAQEEEVDAQGIFDTAAGEDTGDGSFETQQTDAEEAGAKANGSEKKGLSEYSTSESTATEDEMPIMQFEKDEEEPSLVTEASSAKTPDQTEAPSAESDDLGPGKTEPNRETEPEDRTEAPESDGTETSETETSVKPIELPFVPVQ